MLPERKINWSKWRRFEESLKSSTHEWTEWEGEGLPSAVSARGTGRRVQTSTEGTQK